MELSVSAFRGSTIVTTALVHSASPPGFVADDEKDLSPNGRFKPQNGCVVKENDKITLLKRVYTSPIRRSTRVGQKGCAVMHRSKVKHSHSDPVEYPKATIRTTKHLKKSFPKSASTTPVRTENRRNINRNGDCMHTAPDGIVTPNNAAMPSPTKLDFTSPTRVILPDNVNEADFFKPDGTPKRLLLVRITETPEIKRKLAEISRLQFSTSTEIGEMPEKDSVSRDEEDALIIDHPSGDNCSDSSKSCEDLNNQQVDTDHYDSPFDTSHLGEGEDNLDYTVGKNTSTPERRPQQADPGDDSLLEYVLESDSSSSNTLDMKLEDYQPNGINSTLLHAVPDVESINGRDPADEVLCISPLPFEALDSAQEHFSPLPEDLESNRLCLSLPEFLPLELNEAPDEFIVTPEHSSSDESFTSCKDIRLEGSSPAGISASGSVSSRSLVTIVDTSLDERNQPSTTASPVSQKKLQKVNSVSPVNGLRDLSVMRVALSPSAFVTPNRIDTKLFDNANLLDDVCIMNLTPSYKVYSNMKGKEPSPTYASQANSELPCSPGNTSCVSRHTEFECSELCASFRQSPLKTKSSVTSQSSGMPSKLFPKPQDDFQDFSEFDFFSARGPLLPQTFSPVEVTQKLSNTSPGGIHTKSQSDIEGQRKNSPQSQFNGRSSTAEDTSLYRPSHGEKCSKWIEMLESDDEYREKSSLKGVVANSQEQWISASDFLMNEQDKPSGRKKSKRASQRRSSMRIAKRMSLLTLEAELKSSSEQDADDSEQAEVSGALCPKTSISTPKQGEDYVQKNATVSRRRKRPPKKRQQLVHRPMDGAVNVENSSTLPRSAELTDEKTIQEEPSSINQTDLLSDGKLCCQFDTECTFTGDRFKPKKKAVKSWDKQSRRRSARLNPVIFPLTSKSPSPVASNNLSPSKLSKKESELYSIHVVQTSTNSSCSETVSTEEEYQIHLDDDTDPVITKPKTKRPHKQLRRRSARLNPIALPLGCESPTANALHFEDLTFKSDDSDCVLSNLTTAESTIGSAQSVPVDDNSECFSIEPVLEGAKSESASPSQCVALSVEEERMRDTCKSRKRRRRSARLLELSMINVDEEQPTVDKTSYGLFSNPEKGNINGEDISLVGNNPESCMDEGSRDMVAYDEEKDTVTILNEMVVDVNTPSTLIDNLPKVSGSLDDATTVSGEDVNLEKRPSRGKSSVRSYSAKTKESKPKKHRKTQEESVKELYLKRGENKTLKPNNLETIFEELHFSKTGSPLYTGSKKCKRTVNFSEHPWLPRKKKKTQSKSGLSRGKKAAAKDPNIDKKLAALLAECTPASPASSSASSDYQANDPRGHCNFENGSSISQTESDKLTGRLPENTFLGISPISDVSTDVAHFQHAENPVTQKLGLNGEVGMELEETSPRMPQRDTPFKGSAPSGSYGVLLNRLMKNKMAGRVGENDGEAIQE